MHTQTATTRRRVLAVLGAALGAGPMLPAAAQGTYPNRVVKIIVPFVAGGGTDSIARPLAEALSKRLGQTVIIENKAGAGGNIGTDFVAKAPPDGYTLLLTPPAPITQSVALYTKLPYNPATDLTLVSDLATARGVLVVNPSLPVKNFKELIEYAKANPDKVTMGSWGAGTQPHLIENFMERTYGTKIVHVPYKGEGPMMTDLLGGQIAMSSIGALAAKQHLASGKLRALGVIGPKRAAVLPDVPTLAEQGYKDDIFVITAPFSMLAPAKTPPAIVERLGNEVSAIMKSPEMVKQVESLGMEVVGSNAAEANAAYKQRLPVLVKLVRDTGTTLD